MKNPNALATKLNQKGSTSWHVPSSKSFSPGFFKTWWVSVARAKPYPRRASSKVFWYNLLHQKIYGRLNQTEFTINFEGVRSDMIWLMFKRWQPKQHTWL